MSNRFRISQTPLLGLCVLERLPMCDDRGYFERFFCSKELAEWTGEKPLEQINHTLTVAEGTVRGMHFQFPPIAETKFVSCLVGNVFDVAVDLRNGSRTFLKWHGEILSSENHKTMIIPPGFAHGFQTLVADCEMLYFHTASYSPDSEGALNALDPRLDIKWPHLISSRSARDTNHPMISHDFSGINL